MASLEFDAEKHEYSVGGVVVPSVTKALKVLGGYERVPPAVLERKRLLGSAVDAAIQLDLSDDLDSDSLHPDVRKYLEGWWAFRRDVGLDPCDTRIQDRMFHPELRYAGTPDILTVIPGAGVSVIDVKCTHGIEKSFGPQLAAYQQLYIANGVQVERRYVLHLKPKVSDGAGFLGHIPANERGLYNLIPYHNGLTDWTIFQQCLSITNWSNAK
jgi:hypothetical protein